MIKSLSASIDVEFGISNTQFLNQDIEWFGWKTALYFFRIFIASNCNLTEVMNGGAAKKKAKLNFRSYAISIHTHKDGCKTTRLKKSVHRDIRFPEIETRTNVGERKPAAIVLTDKRLSLAQEADVSVGRRLALNSSRPAGA